MRSTRPPATSSQSLVYARYFPRRKRSPTPVAVVLPCEKRFPRRPDGTRLLSFGLRVNVSALALIESELIRIGSVRLTSRLSVMP